MLFQLSWHLNRTHTHKHTNAKIQTCAFKHTRKHTRTYSQKHTYMDQENTNTVGTHTDIHGLSTYTRFHIYEILPPKERRD